MNRTVRIVTRFFSESGFPLFTLSVLAVWQAILAALVFSPGSLGRWGALAADFRVWCFNYDPATDGMDWTAAWIMLSQPPVISLILFGIWYVPIREAWVRSQRRLLGPVLSGIVVALASGGALYFAFSSPVREITLAFPGDRIRTALPAPVFVLENQDGDAVSLRDFHGKVVLLTGIYSTCGTSCPRLVLQSLDALKTLPEELRQHVVFIALTLDPEHDTPDSMARLARGYQVAAPNHHFLTGNPKVVNNALDYLQIARSFNEASQQIDHANLFFLLDDRGRIAYRFSLSDRHEPWLSAALRELVEESWAARRTGTAMLP